MIRNLRVAIGSRLLSWGWRLTPTGVAVEDEVPTPVAHAACPDCGEEVPIYLAPLRFEVDDDGQQVAFADVQMDDVWAHAWTHSHDPA